MANALNAPSEPSRTTIAPFSTPEGTPEETALPQGISTVPD
jgi:hypothetical protein